MKRRRSTAPARGACCSRSRFPLLRPTIVFLVVTSSIAYLRIFDYVYAMTNGQGGPLDATKPLVLKIFETAFTHFEMGYAATQTVSCSRSCWRSRSCS